MYLSEIKKRILKELAHGPLHLFLLANELDEAPFRVRAELKDLRRERLVRDRITSSDHVWYLTDYGYRVANDHNQMELA